VSFNFKGGGNSNTFNIDGTGYSTASAAGLDGADINPTGASINTAAGFGIYYASPTTAVQSISHGLDAAPELYIFKRSDGSRNWYVSVNVNGTFKFGSLNTASNLNTTTAYVADSSKIEIGGGSSVDEVVFAFHSVDNYQKIGNYTGKGSSGKTVDIGFRPRFILIKRIDDTNNNSSWAIYDSERGGTKPIRPNTTGNETSASTTEISFTSTGISIPTSSTSGLINESGNTYIYLAIA